MWKKTLSLLACAALSLLAQVPSLAREPLVNCTVANSTGAVRASIEQLLSEKKISEELFEKTKKELAACNFQYRSMQFNQCTQRYHAYLSALIQFSKPKPGHALGLDQSDSAYFKRAKPYTNLNFLNSPFKEKLMDAFDQTRMGKGESFEPVLALLRDFNSRLPSEQKWRFVAFDGEIGSIDNSDVITRPMAPAGRGTLSIPKAYFEAIGETPRHLYLNFSIPDQVAKPGKNNAEQLSALAIYQNQESKKNHFVIVDHWREKNGKSISVPEHVQNGLGNKSDCRICHVSGPITIRPKDLSRVVQLHPEENGEAGESDLTYINRMISSQTSTIEGEPEQRWPKYGRELKLPQDQVFIEGCFKDKPRQESIEKIQKAMRCNQCHEDGKMRNALLIPPFSNPGEAHRLIQAGAMPPRSTLDEVEKMALKVCLDKDRLLKTRDYLTEISCEAIPVAVPDLNPARAGVVAPEAISGREQKTPTSPRLQDSSQKTKSVISK